MENMKNITKNFSNFSRNLIYNFIAKLDVVAWFSPSHWIETWNDFNTDQLTSVEILEKPDFLSKYLWIAFYTGKELKEKCLPKQQQAKTQICGAAPERRMSNRSMAFQEKFWGAFTLKKSFNILNISSTSLFSIFLSTFALLFALLKNRNEDRLSVN